MSTATKTPPKPTKRAKPIKVDTTMMAVLYSEAHAELFAKLPVATKQRVLEALTNPTTEDMRVNQFVKAVISLAETRAYDLENPPRE